MQQRLSWLDFVSQASESRTASPEAGGEWGRGMGDVHLTLQAVLKFRTFQQSLNISVLLTYVHFGGFPNILEDVWVWMSFRT